jgi:hypothetical protein
MRLRRALAPVVVLAAILASWLPGAAPPVRAADYTLESSARYQIRPDDGEIGVRVALEFTNTTPNPANRFSLFSEIRLAVHDEAVDFEASDDDGGLTVQNGRSRIGGERVHVATIRLREGIRYRDSVAVELRYTLPDTEDSRLRVRPSLVVFPAWGFGTAGEVSVSIPTGYELRVDGDRLTEDGDRLVSGPIDDPAAWLALVTAVRPAEYQTHEARVPLEGGTADLVVRSFSDDEAWGTRTLAAVEEALPRIEEEVGLPYPVRGPLTLTEVVAADASGFGEGSPTGTEIMISFDQPAFTALHQVVHVWVPPPLVEARWIREGLASLVAARVAAEVEIEIEPPYDPAAEAERREEAAFPLDTWAPTADLDAEAYGHAASWAVIAELEEEVGADALRAVLARVSASIGPYDPGTIDLSPEPGGPGAPAVPLTSRSFLDHLEAVSGADLAPLFDGRVLAERDAALLGARTAARAEFDALVEAAGGWGAPDPLRAAMTDWRFDEAMAQVESARGWLAQRDGLLAEMADAGLSAPDRLQQAYRSYGGGPEAVSELEAEREVVVAYVSAAERVNAERSFLERLGLVGGADPQDQLDLAYGRFTEGDLRGAVDAIGEADRIVATAQTGGIVRLVSLVLFVLILIGLAVILFRRRASYTGGP